MTYYKAAQIILNNWNMSKTWDEPIEDEIHGDDAFSIAMKMAYDALIEKSKLDSNMAPETRKPSCEICRFCYAKEEKEQR